MDKSVHTGHRGRFREKIERFGLEGFPDHEILEYVLYAFIPRRNTNDIAHRLIDTFGSLAAVLNASTSELAAISGMTQNAACFLSGMPDIFRAYSRSLSQIGQRLVARGDVALYMKNYLVGKPNEVVYLAGFDNHERLLNTVKLSSGTPKEVNLTVREVTDMALKMKANSIVLAHNHPRGKPAPSDKDVELTLAINTSLHLNGMRLDDHLIISGDDIFSFRSSGLANDWETTVSVLEDKALLFRTKLAESTDAEPPEPKNGTDDNEGK